MNDEKNKSIDDISNISFHLYNTKNKTNNISTGNHLDEYKGVDILRNIPVPIKEENKYQRAAASQNHDSTSGSTAGVQRFSEELNDSLELSSSHNTNNNNNNSKSNNTKNGEILSNGPNRESSIGGSGGDRTRESLEMALERIDELEHELSEKTRLVNELLLSKDEILNAKYKELVEGDCGGNVCKYCSRKLAAQLSILSNNSTSASSSSLNTSSSLQQQQQTAADDLSAHLDVLQNKIQNFFEYVSISILLCILYLNVSN